MAVPFNYNNGEWIIAWKWEFQKSFGKYGWTYYRYCDTKEAAEKILVEHVKRGYPDDEFVIKQKTGPDNIYSK